MGGGYASSPAFWKEGKPYDESFQIQASQKETFPLQTNR
jgi:hypothetical protein